MSVIDPNLIVGRCPFRPIPSSPDDLARLRGEAGLDLAAATGFRSLFYFDPAEGLEQDLEEYCSLADWLHFYAVINPMFPKLEEQIERCAADKRVVGVRLCPALHQYAVDEPRVAESARLAAARGLSVNLTARLFDDRVAPVAVRQAEIAPEQLQTFLRATREATVILSMFFFGELRSLKLNAAELPHLHLDVGCSKPDTASFDELPDWFPPERVMLGTGAPYYYWKGTRLALEGARLTDARKEAILGATAREVLRWR
jgi:predicted TIM-barrel fold metal-dependent hydrolase